MSADDLISRLKPKDLPTVDYLNECFSLSEDGRLFWKERPSQHFGGWCGYKGWNKKYSGKCADVQMGIGYFSVCINGERFKSHRVVFAMANGIDPGSMQIDHINGERGDNRPTNLRLATQSQNTMNFIGNRADSRLKLPRGVNWNAHNRKFEASVTLQGKRSYLGLFKTIEEAATVASAAREKHFGGFWNGR